MAKTKEQKEEVVEKLTSVLKGPTSVFVGFTGISVGEESAMRRTLKNEGLGYMVAKKTLIRRALQGLGHLSAQASTEELPMTGEVAIAYTTSSADATAAARRIHEFGKSFGEGKLSILGGMFEGKLADTALMRTIATIPGMETLRGMFANVINSPRQRFAIALAEIAKTKGA